MLEVIEFIYSHLWETVVLIVAITWAFSALTGKDVL
jgi:hypothetical protein